MYLYIESVAVLNSRYFFLKESWQCRTFVINFITIRSNFNSSSKQQKQQFYIKALSVQVLQLTSLNTEAYQLEAQLEIQL